MTTGDTVRVSFTGTHAQVEIGGRTFAVDRRDDASRVYTCPLELVTAALGSWITLTIAAVAAQKGITLTKIEVEIARKTAEGKPWQTTFTVRVDLGSGLTRRERVILFNSARRCEVHKLLDGEIGMMYELEERGGEKEQG